MLRTLSVCGLLIGLGATAAGQSAPVYKVVIDEGQTEVQATPLPLNPTPRITYGLGQNMNYGFMLDGQRITYSDTGITNNTMVRIDNQDFHFGAPNGQWNPMRSEFSSNNFGKVRKGTLSTWVVGKLHISQILEVVSSKQPKPGPNDKQRFLDTVLVRYEIKNLDTQPHQVGIRTMMDMLVVNNDGALFSSPTTHPKQILNGVTLSGNTLPEYFHSMQIPNLDNPGLMATFTLKFPGKLIGPDRMVLTNLGAGGGWDIPAIQAGDSAIGIFFSPGPVPPGGVRQVAYAYGRGIALLPENEGRMSVRLGGSFEPQKLFTVTAYIDEPLQNQTLTLELPQGMELAEGRQTQPVAPPTPAGQSLLLWKARVLQPGKYQLKLRSSNGVTLTRTVTIARAEQSRRVLPFPSLLSWSRAES